jgi:diaminohydroxyphosphoribosylaminopyrimidine deaminase/5-amino-6-(5-phosphoribosylamino)uracil reductase
MLRLPLTSKLVKSAHQHPLWVITHAEAVERAASHATELREAGVTFLVVEDASLAPHSMLRALGAQGITRLLIEAGPTLSGAFLAAQLVDTMHWYRAPFALGNAGQAPMDGLRTTLANARRVDAHAVGDDHYACYEMDGCLLA